MSQPQGASPASAAVVVDSSVAIKWLVDEPYSDRAAERLRAWAGAGLQLLAPDLIVAEVANALYKRVRRSQLTHDDAQALLAQFLNLGIELAPLWALTPDALHLAQRFSRDACYDAHFLALAVREGCELWTADERLWNGVRRELEWVRWIGE